MESLFKTPTKEYRPIPFWSWNDKLEPEELVQQINQMKKQGIGGFFMHARGGLETDYLSEDWFGCIDASITAACSENMDAWVYDEEGWPSGFAGGKVTALGEDYQAKTIRCSFISDLQEIPKKTIGYYLLNDQYEYKKIDADLLLSYKNENILAVYIVVNPFYIDVASKKAVDAFLQETHTQYYARFQNSFGKEMKGFFTDEPRYVTNGNGDLPWSYEFLSEYKKRYGYDLIENLPELFYNTGNYQRTRYNFWDLANSLFVDNFMKNIFDWCELHSCKVTGHIMMEESLYSQMASTGGVMPFYEYLHIPGVDWLRRMISHPNTPKQVGSAAAQLGKKHVITESFALTGWDVTFEELKWIAEWQFVNGVNLICQHLQGYTIRGLRKRDYPPSLFIQQTWWEKYALFNDYLARLGVILTCGLETVDTLLIHPMRSAWVVYDAYQNDLIKELDNNFSQLSTELSGMHISYHYGDESIINNHGSVLGNRFIIGKISYSTVILPQSYAIDGYTLELLCNFIKNGGKVITVSALPTFTNGDESLLDYLKQFSERVNIKDLKNILKSMVSITENKLETKAISHQLRKADGYSLLYAVNHSSQKTFSTEIAVEGNFLSVYKMDAETGTILPIKFDNVNGKTKFFAEFLPMQSHCFKLSENIAEQPNELSQTQFVTVSNEWKIESMDLNSLTLDSCEYRINGGAWQSQKHVIHLMSELLSMQKECSIELRFSFDIDKEFDLLKNKEFYAVVELADSFSITVNGKRAGASNGYWKDKTFHKVDIKPFIETGKNIILLSKVFYQRNKVYDVLFGKNVYETEINKLTYDTELESIYLLGDFGVKSLTGYRDLDRNAFDTEGSFQIINKPQRFENGDFVRQGLCFFSGRLEISQKICVTDVSGKIVLKLPKMYAAIAEVLVNGQFVKNILWAPYEADISSYISNGENEIEIKLYSSNRNLLGPHHHKRGEVYNPGPLSFTGKWSWVERESEADVNTGIDRNENFWTDRYSMVKFGFEDNTLEITK